MTLRDPAERSRLGAQQQREILGAAGAEPRTLMDSSWRDYVFAEVWTRPGLDRRSRFFIATCAAVCNGGHDIVEGYVRGALTQGAITLGELREAALQLGVYAGWPRGVALDAAISRAAAELGLEPADYPPIRPSPGIPRSGLPRARRISNR
jgi:4-carboxymuconolactone decarboxylase